MFLEKLMIIGILLSVYLCGFFIGNYLRGRFGLIPGTDSDITSLGIFAWPFTLILFIPIGAVLYSIKYISYIADYIEDIGYGQRDRAHARRMAVQDLQRREMFEDISDDESFAREYNNND